MYRSDTEIKLLILRQKYLDAFEYVLNCPVINMQLYRQVAVKLEISTELLKEYRALTNREAINEELDVK